MAFIGLFGLLIVFCYKMTADFCVSVSDVDLSKFDSSKLLSFLKDRCIVSEMNLRSKQVFGCSHCPWLGSSLCDHGMVKGKGRNLISELHASGGLELGLICEKRKYHVLSLYSGSGVTKGSKVISVANHNRLLNDYQDYVLASTFLDDVNRLKQYDHDIPKLSARIKVSTDDYKSYRDSDCPANLTSKEHKYVLSNLREDLGILGVELSRLEDKRKECHSDIIGLGIQLRKLVEGGKDRKSREKTAKETGLSLNLSDIHNIMNKGKVIDAEVVKDDSDVVKDDSEEIKEEGGDE